MGNELALNRVQRRKTGVKITKKDLYEAYERGFKAGEVKGLYRGLERGHLESEKVLKSEFGFGEKRLDKFTRGLVEILRVKEDEDESTTGA